MVLSLNRILILVDTCIKDLINVRSLPEIPKQHRALNPFQTIKILSIHLFDKVNNFCENYIALPCFF